MEVAPGFSSGDKRPSAIAVCLRVEGIVAVISKTRGICQAVERQSNKYSVK